MPTSRANNLLGEPITLGSSTKLSTSSKHHQHQQQEQQEPPSSSTREMSVLSLKSLPTLNQDYANSDALEAEDEVAGLAELEGSLNGYAAAMETPLRRTSPLGDYGRSHTHSYSFTEPPSSQALHSDLDGIETPWQGKSRMTRRGRSDDDLLPSDLGIQASPADTDIQTPAPGYGQHGFQGRESYPSNARVNGKGKGKGRELGMNGEVAPETPMVSSQSEMQAGDLASSFPYALTTPQNPSKRIPTVQPTTTTTSTALNSLQTPIPAPKPSTSTSTSTPTINGTTIRVPKDPSEPLDPATMHALMEFSSEGKKRRRTSPEELKILEEAYERNCLPASEERVRLAKQTGMSVRNVQIWFQNKRQTEKRKANHVTYPTVVLVPLGPTSSNSSIGSAGSYTIQEHHNNAHVHRGKRSPQEFLVPALNGPEMGLSGLGGRGSPRLGGVGEMARFGSSQGSGGVGGNAYGSGSGSGMGMGMGSGLMEEQERMRAEDDAFFSPIPTSQTQESTRMDDDEDDTRGRQPSQSQTIPTSDVRSSSPLAGRSSSPSAFAQERKRKRVPSAEGKDPAERIIPQPMLFHRTETAAFNADGTPCRGTVKHIEEVTVDTAAQRLIGSIVHRSGGMKRSMSERGGPNLRRTVIGVADIVDSGKNEMTTPMVNRKLAATSSVPTYGARGEATFRRPEDPSARTFSRHATTQAVRLQDDAQNRSFTRSQSKGILDEMCKKKELPFLPPSASRRTSPRKSQRIPESPSPSPSKKRMARLLDLLPSDPPSMGLVDNSDAEDAPMEGDTDVDEQSTPKKRKASEPTLRKFASLDYYAGSPSKRKGPLGDESRRLGAMTGGRKRLFEAEAEQQRLRSEKRRKLRESGEKPELTRSGSSSSVSNGGVTATPARTAPQAPRTPVIVDAHETPGRPVRTQDDEEAARLLMGLFGKRN